MGFIAGPTKTIANPAYPDPDDPDDPQVAPTITDPLYNQGSGKIGYFTPLRGQGGLDGLGGLDIQTRSVNHGGYGEYGSDASGTNGIWLSASHPYTDGQGRAVYVVYTYTPASAGVSPSVSHSPNPIPGDWTPAVAPTLYANRYTAARCNADGLSILQSLEWSAADGASAASLSYSTADSAPAFGCTEIRYRLIYPVLGTPGTGNVKFRWREKTVTTVVGSSGTTAYGPEQTETVALSEAAQITTDADGNLTGDPYACGGYHTVLYADMHDDETVSIIGPADSSYLLGGGSAGLSVRNSVVGFQANANNGGYSAYVQPQAAAGTVAPLALYAAETASAAPGTAADFSGSQSITSTPTPGNDAGGQPLPTSTYVNTLSDPAQSYRSDVLGQQNGRRYHAPEIRGTGPTTLRFGNGLILTLSQPVDLDTVASDCSAWLDAYFTALQARDPQYSPTTSPPPAGTPPPLPAPPVWINADAAPGGLLASGNGPLGSAAVYLLGRHWTSEDQASLEQALSVLTIAFDPGALNGVSVDSGTPGASVYNQVRLDFTWDVVTEDLATGHRTTAQGTASYAFDGSVPPPAAPMVDAEYQPVPAANTRVFIENFQVTPDEIDFLEIGPVFEIEGPSDS